MPGSTTTLHLPYPVPDDTVDVPRDVKALADAVDVLGTVPVGAFMLWLLAGAPAGWLLMQGQKVSAATYPQLATLLGQDAGGLVLIPDMRDVFPVGAGPATPLGQLGGLAAVTLAIAQIPAHAHGVNDPSHVHATDAQGGHAHGGATGAADRGLGHAHSYSAPGSTALVTGSPTGSGVARAAFGAATGGEGAPDHLHGIAWDGSHGHNIDARYTGVTIQNNGGGGAHENRPPYRSINFIIRAG